MLHAEPSSKHTTIRAAKDDTGLVLHLVFCANELNELNVIHHYLLYGKIDVMLGSKGYGGFIWVANAEVAVLSEHDQSLCLLGNCLSHEARVVVEAVNVTFVASIEEDRASLGVPVGIVNKVPHLEALRLTIGSKVIYFGPKHEGLC